MSRIHRTGAPSPIVPARASTGLEPPAPRPTVPDRPSRSGPVLRPRDGLPPPVSGSVASLGWQSSQPRSEYWLEQTLLKAPPAGNIPLDDVSGGPPALGVELPRLDPADDRHAVYAKLAQLPLARLLTSPGYRFYRSPSQFPAILEQVKTTGQVDTNPSILDIHTDGNGRVVSADLDSHHLRMAAFLEAGRRTLGEIPFDQLIIKVDGVQRGDKVWPMKTHGYALSDAQLARCTGRATSDTDGIGTVTIPNTPNYELGSRTTLGRFHQTLLHRTPPKLGMFFCDLNASPQDAVLLAKAFKAREGLDEVVLVPEPDLSETARAHLAQVTSAVLAEDGLNLYRDEPASLHAHFPDLDFHELVKLRLNLLYGTALEDIRSA